MGKRFNPAKAKVGAVVVFKFSKKHKVRAIHLGKGRYHELPGFARNFDPDARRG